MKTVGAIIGFVLLCFIIYLVGLGIASCNYKVYYEGMVKHTVHDMIKDSCLEKSSK